jgi:hypothetical protein
MACSMAPSEDDSVGANSPGRQRVTSGERPWCACTLVVPLALQLDRVTSGCSGAMRFSCQMLSSPLRVVLLALALCALLVSASDEERQSDIVRDGLYIGPHVTDHMSCESGHHLVGSKCVKNTECRSGDDDHSCNHHGLCDDHYGFPQCICNPGFMSRGVCDTACVLNVFCGFTLNVASSCLVARMANATPATLLCTHIPTVLRTR